MYYFIKILIFILIIQYWITFYDWSDLKTLIEASNNSSNNKNDVETEKWLFFLDKPMPFLFVHGPSILTGTGENIVGF